jgi:hypothetical protein
LHADEKTARFSVGAAKSGGACARPEKYARSDTLAPPSADAMPGMFFAWERLARTESIQQEHDMSARNWMAVSIACATLAMGPVMAQGTGGAGGTGGTAGSGGMGTGTGSGVGTGGGTGTGAGSGRTGPGVPNTNTDIGSGGGTSTDSTRFGTGNQQPRTGAGATRQAPTGPAGTVPRGTPSQRSGDANPADKGISPAPGGMAPAAPAGAAGGSGGGSK